MDIPIRLKFFDKLKIYQDYLKKDAMLEKTKSEYWLYEKAILYWAYSGEHQHLGRPLDENRFCKDPERVNKLPVFVAKISNNSRHVMWVKEHISGSIEMEEKQEAARQVTRNLKILGFADKVKEAFGPEQYKIHVNEKGFLLGELLFETFNNPGFLSKNFRKYKIAMLTFYFLFTVLLGTTVLIFFEKIINFLGKETMFSLFTKLKSVVFYDWWSLILILVVVYLISRFVWNKL